MSSLASTITNSLLRFRGIDASGPFRYVWDERREAFDYADRMYDNEAYGEDVSCFQRKEIFKRIMGREYRRKEELLSHVNPIASIVDAYQYCVRGKLGGELILERDGQDLPPEMQKAIATIWRDSRLDLQLEPYQHFGANYGATLLRIEADPIAKRVLIRPWHPKTLIDIDESSTGAISGALFEYDVLTGPLGEERETITYRERVTKTTLQRWRVDKEKDTKQTIPNALGVCPIVLVRHRDKGREVTSGAFGGLSSWQGSDNLIHLLNIRMSQAGLSISKALWAKWFIASAGDAPSSVPLSGEKLIHVKLNPDDPPTQIKSMVEPINAAAASDHIDQIAAALIQRQPEMVLTHLESLSGQSGETIRKLLTPVTSKIIDARTRYETGLIDAVRQALSWQVLVNGGTKDAADAAYRSGDLDFSFAKRPALPPTSDETIVDARAQYAERVEAFKAASAASSLLPTAKQLELAGYDEEEAIKLATEVDKRAVEAAKTKAPFGA